MDVRLSAVAKPTAYAACCMHDCAVPYVLPSTVNANDKLPKSEAGGASARTNYIASISLRLG